MKSVLKRICRFRDEERGSILIEALMMVPLMFWATVALFSYWDTYRSINMVQKATYTLSDIISRRTEVVAPAYIDGLRSTMDFIIDANLDPQIRVTSVTYIAAMDRYTVDWSYSPANAMPAFVPGQEVPTDFRQDLPMMGNATSVIVVESSVQFTPALSTTSILGDTGLQTMTLGDFIVNRPRNGQIGFTG